MTAGNLMVSYAPGTTVVIPRATLIDVRIAGSSVVCRFDGAPDRHLGPFPTDEETMQVCRRVVHALASETSVLDVTQPAPPTPLPHDLEPPKPLSALTRDDVLKMHTHYNGLIAKELEFCFKYLNFYIGLLSALVAATLTGLLQFTLPHPRGLLLLLGPLLVIVLAVVGYKTVRVFYRRYMEAWITSLNVDEMLGLRTDVSTLFRTKNLVGF